MKRVFLLLTAAIMLFGLISGCSKKNRPGAGEDGPQIYADGRARPSSCGRLCVKSGDLCSESGEPVMLRGVSTNDLMVSESFINDALFRELSKEGGVNVCRFAVYTYGVGIIGYCTKGDKERYENDLERGIELAAKHDMYAIIDWHVLSDGDPNVYADEAELFFKRMAKKYSGSGSVIYEICNEPNGVDWPAVKRYAERIIPVIRAEDPEAVIIVGTPDWSKDLKSAASDPLGFENVMYALHFYSASHGQDLRDIAESASESGLPIFATEFGVTASSGDLPRDIESANEWIDLLERENVSYCMWSLAKAPEACSMVRATVPKYSGFTEEDYTESGRWLLDVIGKHSSK